MKEIWKTVENFSNYRISNYGNIISFPRKGNHFKKPTILKQNLDKYGYKVVGVVDDNKKKRLIKVHRLVAKAFIPNPNGYPCINHKNEIKTDNSVNNLEWCSVKHNNNYGSRLNKCSQALSKEVKQYDENGNFIKSWVNAKIAAITLNICRTSIYCCCNKKPNHNTAGGFKWEYAKGDDE